MRERKCQQCGQCCKRLSPTCTIEDMNREPRLWHYAVPIHKVGNPRTRRYMAEKQMPWGLKSPCPFQANNLCLIHETRPQICRDYPQESRCIREMQELCRRSA